MKKKYFLSCLALILHLLCVTAFAWNANGHVLISQLAYEQLKPTTKKKVDEISQALYKQLPFSTQYELDQKYPNVSEFAKISILPDQFRKQPLNIIFEQYQGELPSSFVNIAGKNTAHWHFIDRTYPNQNCAKHSSENAIWAVNTLKPLLSSEKNLISQGIILSMFTHFVEDMHQPLHTFSLADKNCKTDKGGNAFCLYAREGKYCKRNLHHLWDTGVGFLKGRQSHHFSRKMRLVSENFPLSALTTESQEIHPETWAKQNYTHAKFIYSLEPYQKPYAAYYKEGQRIAKKQMALASYRLAFLLNQAL